MSQYRRAYQDGGCYFFTHVTYQRQPIFAEQANIERLRQALQHVKKTLPFDLDAIVILPDHLHCIWQLPQNDANFSERWRQIKRFLSIGITATKNARGEKLIWQRRYWEHLVRDEDDWRRHMDYIHYNPVKHGYVDSAIAWPYSSFKRAVEQGWYDAAWCEQEPVSIKNMQLE